MAMSYADMVMQLGAAFQCNGPFSFAASMNAQQALKPNPMRWGFIISSTGTGNRWSISGTNPQLIGLALPDSTNAPLIVNQENAPGVAQVGVWVSVISNQVNVIEILTVPTDVDIFTQAMQQQVLPDTRQAAIDAYQQRTNKMALTAMLAEQKAAIERAATAARNAQNLENLRNAMNSGSKERADAMLRALVQSLSNPQG